MDRVESGIWWENSHERVKGKRTDDWSWKLEKSFSEAPPGQDACKVESRSCLGSEVKELRVDRGGLRVEGDHLRENGEANSGGAALRCEQPRVVTVVL